MPTLQKVLDVIQPEQVAEYGTGKSTQVISLYPSVKFVQSVEHDSEWYERALGYNLINANVVHYPRLDDYVWAISSGLYDLVFVDGRERVRCMKNIKPYLHINSVVMLHDAQREKYEKAYDFFKYCILTDQECTATFTDSTDVYNRLEEALIDNA